MSGNGLRVIYRYEGEDYPAAFAMGNDCYAHLIGKESDPLCKNITRRSGLAYDPEVYFNPEATAFSAEEISHFHSATLKTAHIFKSLFGSLACLGRFVSCTQTFLT